MTSNPRPVTATSQLIRLFNNFVTLIPSFNFSELLVVSMEQLLMVAYHLGIFTLPDTWFRPFFGLAYAPIVETSFPELAVSFLDFYLEYPSVLSRFCLEILRIHTWLSILFHNTFKTLLDMCTQLCECKKNGRNHYNIFGIH